ncbi:MAG: hypothetical protein HKN59_06125 [Gammaproteobacteria bacterium]|nr:hypothetical protein [Gammaproteobacteria bacterium]
MGANYLVQLAAEWYEFQGYFVLRNVKVAGTGKAGGGELDVLAQHPTSGEFVHVEASMDSDSWEKRDKRFRAKFRVGQAHVEAIARGFRKKPVLRQRALLGYARAARRRTLGGGELVLIPGLLHEIIDALSARRLDRRIVPEHLPLLRTLQFVSEYRDDLFARDQLF